MFKKSDNIRRRIDVTYRIDVDADGMLRFIKSYRIYNWVMIDDPFDDIPDPNDHIVDVEIRKSEALSNIDPEEIAEAYAERKLALKAKYDPVVIPEEIANIANRFEAYLKNPDRPQIIVCRRVQDTISGIVSKLAPKGVEVDTCDCEAGSIYIEVLSSSVDFWFTDELGRTEYIGDANFRVEMLPRRKYEDRKWQILPA